MPPLSPDGSSRGPRGRNPQERGGNPAVILLKKVAALALAKFREYKEIVKDLTRRHFRWGRAAYICIMGGFLLLFAGVVLLAAFDSRDARAAPHGWPTFVAVAGSQQWVSYCIMMASATVVLSINYLPKLEGEA
ncbi:unnamed protein product [Amoebophrya sp. A25]|nr:unnamed protein product [Amoebophrya sp. A25]|eukprot:GSA25T00006979001.1